VLLLPEGDVLVVLEVDPAAVPDWLADPAPVENVSLEVDCASLLGLVLVLVPVDPLIPEVDVSLCPLVVLLAVLPEMLPEVLGALVLLPVVAPAAPAVLLAAAFSSTCRLLLTD
jgi:hypothetical protein